MGEYGESLHNPEGVDPEELSPEQKSRIETERQIMEILEKKDPSGRVISREQQVIELIRASAAIEGEIDKAMERGKPEDPLLAERVSRIRNAAATIDRAKRLKLAPRTGGKAIGKQQETVKLSPPSTESGPTAK
jgi:hypothetical protein